MIGSLGFPEIIMIFVVVMLLFGPKKLPEFAKMLGKIIREVRSTVDHAKNTISEEIDLNLDAEDTELLPPEEDKDKKETKTEKKEKIKDE